MNIKRLIPAPADIGREAIIVIAGALLAALIIGQLPPVKAWIRRQWGEAMAPGS